MNRRSLFLAGVAAIGVGGAGPALAYEPPAYGGDLYFREWLTGFEARAVAAGLPQAFIARELAGLAPDPRVLALDAAQPEFAKPVSAYIASAVNASRLERGRAERFAVPAFGRIEATYGVPRDILIAIWAMESNFGGQQGDFDIVRCFATLAASGRRRAWAEAELIAALRILASGAVSRARLRGSWAGAMGQTQLLPTVYLSTARRAEGVGRSDIWGSAGDALASAANLLREAGWRRGGDWAREVILPAQFDWGLSEGPIEPPQWWAARGARRTDGRDWSAPDRAASASLLLPAGRRGPAFLAFPNHFAIRAYNNSIAYALAVGLLADGFAGRGGVRTPWPREIPLSLTARLDAQQALARLGYNPGAPDGVIGLGSRQALRGWQRRAGLPADGYLTPELVERLRAEARL